MISLSNFSQRPQCGRVTGLETHERKAFDQVGRVAMLALRRHAFDQYGRVASLGLKRRAPTLEPSRGRRPDNRSKGADPKTALQTKGADPRTGNPRAACCVSQFLPFPAWSCRFCCRRFGLLGARPFRLCGCPPPVCVCARPGLLSPVPCLPVLSGPLALFYVFFFAFCFQGDDPRTDLWSGNPLLLEYLRSLCYGRGICRWWGGCLFFW